MTTEPGRNDPCPCGSGKKYKKSCMLKEQPAKPLSKTLLDEACRKAAALLMAFAKRHSMRPEEMALSEELPVMLLAGGQNP